MAMKNEIIKILEKDNRDTIYSDDFEQVAEEIENLYYKDKIKYCKTTPSAYDGSLYDSWSVVRPLQAHHTIRNNNPYLDGYALTIDEMKKLLERYDEVKDDEDFFGYYNFIEYYMSYENKEAVNVYKE